MVCSVSSRALSQTQLFDRSVVLTRGRFARDQRTLLCRGLVSPNKVLEYSAYPERSDARIARIALEHGKNRTENRAQPSQSDAVSDRVGDQVVRRDNRMQDHRKAT